MIESIDYIIENGIDAQPNRKKLEQILMSIADKSVISQKKFGKASVQNANTFLEKGIRKVIKKGKKGEEKIIYNKHSNFSLPNQKGYIELRQPDGKTSDKVSYAKEKTIGENELYKLTGEKTWSWINQPLLGKTEESLEIRKNLLGGCSGCKCG